MAEYNGHETRFSDASRFDEICEKCGATDAAGDDGLNRGCPYAGMTVHEVHQLMKERREREKGGSK